MQEEKKEYAKALKRLVKENWTNKKRDISQVLHENFDGKKHIMFVEENVSLYMQISNMLQEENSLLEKVELIDYWKMCENGRTNQTR